MRGDAAGGLSSLDRAMRSNLVGDLTVQVLTLLVYVLAVRSGWLLVLWLVRWVVVGAVVAALRFERRGHRHAALLLLIGGHCFGVVGTVALLPQFVPVTVLVLISDLTLTVPFASGRRARFYYVLIVGSVTIAGGLSLQSWTGLAYQAPTWLLVVFILGHLVGTVHSLVTNTRAAELTLRNQVSRLSAARGRSSSAADAASRELRVRLDAGPVRVLGELEAVVDQIERAMGEGRVQGAWSRANAAADTAQDCLRDLREISHGLLPDVPVSGGLAAAVAALARRPGSQVSAVLTEVRAHPTSENAVYSALVSVLVACQDVADAAVELRTTAGGGRLHFRVEVRSVHPLDLDVLTEGAVDRVEAIGGELHAAAGSGRSYVTGSVPLQIDRFGTQLVGATTAPDEAATLMTFLRLSTWFASGGILVVVAAYLVTRLPILIYVSLLLSMVAGCLALAGLALGRGRPSLAAALISVESSTAALAVTALVPQFSPVTTAIAVLPMVVTPPGVSARAVRGTTVVQTIAALGTTLLGVLGGITTDLQTVPGWLIALVLPPATGGVAALVGATSSSSLTRLHDLVARTQQSSARMVVVADEHRRRIERDLHDGAQQGIVAVSLQFRSLALVMEREPSDQLGPTLTTLRRLIASARNDLDVLTHGMFPPRLADGDLLGALFEAVDASPMTVQVRVRQPGGVAERVSPEVAAGVYFACLEALQNAAKHAGDDVTVTVELGSDGHTLAATITDDGPGVDPRHIRIGTGLSNIADRIGALDGRWALSSPGGAGLRVEVVVPLAQVG